MTDANAGQKAFWSEAPGQTWVRFQEDLDLIQKSVLDLLIAAAVPEAGENVLEIGCGTGDLAFAIAAAVGGAGRVQGVDISPTLLGLAEERRVAQGVSHVQFVEADAQTADLGRGLYDLVVSRFGVMFFADPIAAFANIGAALKPGGRLVFAAWTGPEDNPWFRIPQEKAEAQLGPAPKADPHAPGPMAFRDGDRVLEILEQAGFRDVAYAPTGVSLHHPGGMPAIMALAPFIGPLSRMMRDKGGTEADRGAILSAIEAAYAPFVTETGIRLPAGVNLVTARWGD